MNKKDNIINVEFNNAKFESNDILDEALECTSITKALKLAKKALEIYPNNIDAMNFITEYEKSPIKKLEKYTEIVGKATQLLEEDNIFSKDNIGIFWGLMETRPYMRARHNKLLCLMTLGRYSEAIKECEELLKLCTSDNMGIRYILIGLYCILEKFEEGEKLFEKYEDYSANFLLPMAILYYKKGEYKKSKKFLNELNTSNEFILDFLVDGDVLSDNEVYDTYFSYGSEEEAFMVINNLFYLLASVPEFINFVRENYND